MSDIRIYSKTDAENLVPLTGDVIICSEAGFNGAQANSVHLCTNATGPVWKSFENNGAVAPPFNEYSLDFDGTDDYVDCGGDADFSFTDGAGNDSAFSISAWVKLDANARGRIVTKGNIEWLFGTDGSGRFALWLYGSATNIQISRREQTALSTGTWHHLVATYDGSKTVGGINIYRAGGTIDTTPVSQGSYTGMSSQQGALNIGRWQYDNSFYKGLVDEVAVFDYELTASEVASLSSDDNTQPVDISTLSITQPIAWYRMGDDIDRTGTSIKNAANSGANDGTIVNGTDGNTTPNFVDLNATSESIYVA